MAKIHIENGIISSSADYSLYHGTSPLATIEPGGFRVQGDIIAENMIVSSSTTYMTTSFSAGSTAFGDSSDDIHQFTGSLMVSASGQIGIGTNNPSNPIHIRGTDAFMSFTHETNSAQAGILYRNTSGTNVGFAAYNFSTNLWEVRVSNQTRLTLASSYIHIGGDGAKVSGSASSTGSFGAVSIGKGTADNNRALTIVGNVQLNNNNAIYFKRSSGTADPHIIYNSSNNFNIFNPVAGEIILSVGSAEIVAVDSGGLTFNGSKTLGSSSGAGVITIAGNSGLKLKSGGGGGSGPIELIQGSTTYWSVGPEGTLTGSADLVMNAGKNISGSATSTGSFGTLRVGTNVGSLSSGLVFGDGNTGFYENTDNILYVTTAASDRWKFDGSSFISLITGGPALYGEAATSTNPTLIPHKSDNNTGIGRASADNLSLIAGGAEILRLASNTISGSSTSTGSFGRLETAGTAKITSNLTTNKLILSNQGSQSSPAITFSVDDNTGIYQNTDNELDLSINNNTIVNMDYYNFNIKSATNLNVGISDDVKFKVTYDGKHISGSSISTGSFGSVVAGGTGFNTFVGNVGIGDASPSEKLDVSGGHINIDSGYAYKINESRFLLYNGNTFLGDIDNLGGDVFIREDGSTKMTISEGNVGIGTTSPTEKLTIFGGVASPATSGTGANGNLAVESSNGNSLYIGSYYASPYGVWLQASNYADQSLTYPIILNPNGGNVGIGTTSPSAKLDVVGDAHISGSMMLKESAARSDNDDSGLVLDLYNTYSADDARSSIRFWSKDPHENYGARLRFHHNNDWNYGAGTFTLAMRAIDGSGLKEVIAVDGNQYNLEFPNVNKISGSATSTGSFGNVESTTATIPTLFGSVNLKGDNVNLDWMHGDADQVLRIEIDSGNDAYFSVTGNNDYYFRTNSTTALKIDGSQNVTVSAGDLVVEHQNLKVNSGADGSTGLIRLYDSNDKEQAEIYAHTSDQLRFWVANGSKYNFQNGDIEFNKANAMLSGSSTSTGSFGSVQTSTLFSTDGGRVATMASGQMVVRDHFSIAATKAIFLDGGSNTFIRESSSDNIEFATNNTVRLNIGNSTSAFRNNVTLLDTTNIGTSTFVSGITGDGFRIEDNGSDGTFLEVDNIFVRNTLRTHIFQKDIVKATNGILFISDSGVISGSTGTTGTGTVTFDNTKSATFNDNDILFFKDASDDGTINGVQFQINGSKSTSGDFDTYNVDNVVGNLSNLNVGGTAARISGGTVAIDASSNHSPFIDVNASSGSAVVRMGKLSGITSPVFGSLGEEFGLWASGSVYLEGSINATSGGFIAGWSLNSNTIEKVDSNGGVKIDSSNKRIDFLSDASTTRLRVGQVDSNKFGMRGFNDGGTRVFEISEVRNEIAGWAITTGAISSSAGNVQIDSDNSRFLIQDSSGQQRVRMGKLNSSNQYGISGSDSAGKLLFKLGEAGNEIAGWGITETVISSSDGNVQIDAGNSRFLIKSGSGERVRMGLLNDSKQYGISGSDENGNLLFKLGDAGNEIAGWRIAQGKLDFDHPTGSIAIDASNKNIAIYTGSIDAAKPKVVMGNLPTTGDARYGFAVFSGSADADISDDNSYAVLITKDKARLAGWDLVPGRLKSGTVADINGNKASIALGGGSGGTNALNAGSTPTSNLFFVSASSNPIFYVGENFSYVNDVLTAAGWTVDTNAITKINADGGIKIHSGNKQIIVYSDNGSTERVILGDTSGGDAFGIKGKDGSNNTLFVLGEEGNEIAGWTIGTGAISKNDVKLDSTSNAEGLYVKKTSFSSTTAGGFLGLDSGVAKFNVGNSSKFIKFDGSNFTVDAGNFSLDSSGNMTATSANLTGTVTATAGAIGGYTIGSGKLSVGSDPGVNISGSGVIIAGNISSPGPEDAVYFGVLREHGGSSGISGSVPGLISGDSSIPTFNSGTHLGFQINKGVYFKAVNDEAHFRVGGTSTGQPFINFNQQTPSLEISSSNFHLDASGNVDMTGTVTATAGAIGGFTIANNDITGSGGIFVTSNKSTGPGGDTTRRIELSRFNLIARSPAGQHGSTEGFDESRKVLDLIVTSSYTYSGGEVSVYKRRNRARMEGAEYGLFDTSDSWTSGNLFIGMGGRGNASLRTENNDAGSTQAMIIPDTTNNGWLVGQRMEIYGANIPTSISTIQNTSHAFAVRTGTSYFAGDVTMASDLKISATNQLYFDGGTHTYITETSDDELAFVVGNQRLLTMDEDNDRSIFYENIYVQGAEPTDNTLDDDYLRLHNNGSHSYIDFGSGNLYIRDDGTTAITITDSTRAVTIATDLTVSDDLFVNDCAHIDALHVGTGTDTDPGDGRLLVDDYGVFVGGLRVGSSSDPGADNLSVAGDVTIGDDLFVGDCAHIDALHVGTGTDTDPGDGNLSVDGNILINGITDAGGVPKFLVRRTSDQALTQNAWNTIVFNGEDFDTGSDFNVTNGIFSAPATGYYHFSWQLRFNSLPDSTDYIWTKLVTTDEDILAGIVRIDAIAETTIDYWQVGASVTVHLDSGDTVKVQGYPRNSGTGVTIDGASSNYQSWFSGHMII